MNYQKKRLASPAIAAAISMLLLAGCSAADPDSQPTMTQSQATARIQQILQGTGPFISPRPRLEIDKRDTYTGPCLEEPPGHSDARVQISRAYVLQGVPKQANASVAAQVLHGWKSKGYKVSTFRTGTSSPQIHGTAGDNFLISLQSNSQGQLTIGATSPCLWPDGTPPPGQ